LRILITKKGKKKGRKKDKKSRKLGFLRGKFEKWGGWR
jgi:hypothetical protein